MEDADAGRIASAKLVISTHKMSHKKLSATLPQCRRNKAKGKSSDFTRLLLNRGQEGWIPVLRLNEHNISGSRQHFQDFFVFDAFSQLPK